MDLAALEAYVAACIGAVQSAFYRLEKETGKALFKAKHKAWRRTLTQVERSFLNRMIRLRDTDVHKEDIMLSSYVSVLPSRVFQTGPDSKDVTTRTKYLVHGDEVSSACGRFLSLMEGFVEYCQR